MRVHRSRTIVLVMAGFLGLAACSPALGQAVPPDVAKGKAFFEHVWQVDDPLATGDGLGPMFNDRSCVGCHSQGGSGGAGANDRNVERLSVDLPADAQRRKRLQVVLAALHPDLAVRSNIALHRFSTTSDYGEFRQNLLFDPPASGGQRKGAIVHAAYKRQQSSPVKHLKSHGQMLLLSQRSTPALFGAGLIDQIPQSELQAVARRQPHEDANVSGRLLGRFGWRGQVGRLADFVSSACAAELGLSTPSHSQAVDVQLRIANVQNVDLTQEQCDDLTAFVASLPVPRVLEFDDAQQRNQATTGEALLRTVGCVVCHRPTLGDVDDLYSDLLLHDMGSHLEDPSGAPTSLTSGVSGYGGQPQPFTSEQRREWRTPPLWGLRDSAPYLHDGRAATVEDAILWHGGEAAGSRDRYLALDAASRGRVLLFLSTLAAPDLPKAPVPPPAP